MGRRSATIIKNSLSLLGYQTWQHEGIWWILPQTETGDNYSTANKGLPELNSKTAQVKNNNAATPALPWQQANPATVTLWICNQSKIHGDRRRLLAQIGKANTPNTIKHTLTDVLASLNGYSLLVNASDAIPFRIALDWLATQSDGKLVQRFEANLYDNQKTTFSRVQDVRFLSGSTTFPTSGNVATTRNVETVNAGLTIDLYRTIESQNEDILTTHVQLSSVASFDANGLPQTQRTESHASTKMSRSVMQKILSFTAQTHNDQREKVFGLFPAKTQSTEEDSYVIYGQID